MKQKTEFCDKKTHFFLFLHILLLFFFLEGRSFFEEKEYEKFIDMLRVLEMCFLAVKRILLIRFVDLASKLKEGKEISMKNLNGLMSGVYVVV